MECHQASSPSTRPNILTRLHDNHKCTPMVYYCRNFAWTYYSGRHRSTDISLASSQQSRGPCQYSPAQWWYSPVYRRLYRSSKETFETTRLHMTRESWDISVSQNTFYNRTTVYKSFDYSNLLRCWAFVDKIWLRHVCKAPIDDCPGTMDILPWRPFEARVADLSRRNNFSSPKILSSRTHIWLRPTLCALKGESQILSNRMKLTNAQATRELWQEKAR